MIIDDILFGFKTSAARFRRFPIGRANHLGLLVRVQCFRKGSYKAVEGPSTRPIVLSMITWSYCRRRRRLTIFEPDEMKSVCL